MDAREIIADAACRSDWNKLDTAHYLICRLAAHGYQIIHRDENHGPTLERGGFAEPDVMAMSNGVISLHYEDLDAAQSAFDWLEARAMEVKHHG